MRRRQLTQDEALRPRRLVEYRAEDWPEPECHPGCAYWAAVSEWQDAHPDESLPVAPGTGPDTPCPELI